MPRPQVQPTDLVTLPNISSDALAFADRSGATRKRRSWTIQNLGSNPLFIRLGSEEADADNFHYILAGGTVEKDGRGMIFGQSEGNIHQHEIHVYGVTPLYSAVETF